MTDWSGFFFKGLWKKGFSSYMGGLDYGMHSVSFLFHFGQWGA